MAEIQISLESARVNAEMTQAEAAEIMNVDRSTIRRWERGEKIPNYDESRKLSEIYEIPIDNIFFGKRTRKKRVNMV